MPNYYAHFKFGTLVFEALSEEIRAVLTQERAAFDLGCLGPDPLFFYRPFSLRNPARDEALAIHKNPFRPAALRLRQAVEQGLPMSRGYAAGFLCHFGLDSACHSYVNREAAKGRHSHMGLEAGLDRLLMAEDGGYTPWRTAFPRAVADPRVYDMAAAVYQNADGGTVRRGYRAMALDARLLARLAGRGLPAVSLRLKALLEGAVEETAGQIVDFLAGVPLGCWYDRDFNGGT